ncbi:restriction endonuclease subunit S [Arthrobacter sp. 131MFCol6.1]|uniref:restriction endonuclease subunit S n=1 Tax=Arthrobacter sp. 131MFCol6.1 TaxID=1157944 RepID=UPI00037926BF|nr:restriction endonuclease subunit S [Arthrobacter sp. 131MFCol6.1]
MTGIKQYDIYKDSGIEWVGSIPVDWETCPLFAVARENTASNKAGVELNLLSLSYGRIVRKDIAANDGLLPASFDTYQVISRNDIVLRLTDLQNDKRSLRSAISPERGIITSAYLAVTPTRILPNFLSYLLRAYDLQKVFYAMGGGLRQSMKFSDMKWLPLVVPPEQLQESIAAYLDRETAQIDDLIAKQERLVDLFAEKRQSIITNAVTRGLDPTARLKPTGFPWLDDVPAHWRVAALKHVLRIPISDGPHETPEFLDEGVPFVSAEAVSSGVVNFSKIRGFISDADNKRYSRKYSPRRGDIYMIKSGATTGVTALVETDQQFNIWSPLAAIRCDDTVLPEFLLAFLRSRAFLDSVALHWSFGTQQNIGMGVLGDLPVAIPPMDEQRRIVDHLRMKTLQINVLTDKAHAVVATLKERRSALISAAVTGKIKVDL